MKRRLISGVLVACCYGSGASAGSTLDINLLNGQPAEFTALVKDLGAALSYKAVSPAENLGLIGFDVGIEVTRTSMESNAWKTATAGDGSGNFMVPKVHAHLGIPFIGIDVGAFYTEIPNSNISVFGAEVKYEVVEGGTVTPAVSLRGTVTDLTGVDDFELSTKGIELSISKGFLMATPYIGIGIVQVEGKYNGNDFVDVKETLDKTFVGLNFNLGLINFDAETDMTGDNSTTSIKIGIRF